MMQENTITHAVIATESGPISVRDLSYFFYHFRAIYVEALSCKREYQIDSLPPEAVIKQLAEKTTRSLAAKGNLAVSRNALKELPAEEELAIADISRRNPLDVVFSSVEIAILIAVIISGGEIKWDKDGVKVKLPPLGKGIAELKKAIYGNKQSKHKSD